MLPPEALALEQTLDDLSDLTIEAEQIVAHSTAWTMPCLWVGDTDFEAVDEALASDPSVAEIAETYEFADGKYYQVEWTGTVKRRINSYIDKSGSILNAEAYGVGWEMTLRFASREQFNTFREYLQNEGHNFDLMNLTEPGAPRQAAVEVTPAQRDALVTAVEEGYYRVPREANLRDVAAALDMSHQSLSELLRRGTANLVVSTLTTSDEPNLN